MMENMNEVDFDTVEFLKEEVLEIVTQYESGIVVNVMIESISEYLVDNAPSMQAAINVLGLIATVAHAQIEAADEAKEAKWNQVRQ